MCPRFRSILKAVAWGPSQLLEKDAPGNGLVVHNRAQL